MRKFGWLCFIALVFYAGYLYGTRPTIQKAVRVHSKKAVEIAQNAVKDAQ